MRSLILSVLPFLILPAPTAGQRPAGAPGTARPIDGRRDRTSAVPVADEVLLEAIVDEKPSVLSGPQLVYPEILRQARIQGRVIVQAIIDTTGRAEPKSLKILQSPNQDSIRVPRTTC